LTKKTFEDFAEQVPIRDYEDLKPYVEKVVTEKRISFEG
jgi:hypothetical protein